MNKKGGESQYRGLGAIDISAVARSVLTVGKLPLDEEITANRTVRYMPLTRYRCFTYSGSTMSNATAINWINGGGVIVAGMNSSSSGHLIAAVAVSSDGKSFLCLDSYPSSSRNDYPSGISYIPLSLLGTYYLIK